MGNVGRPKRYKTPEAEEAAKERRKKQAERIGNLLKSHGISGRELGEYLGVTEKSISQYRTGRVELAFEYAEKLSKAYEYIPEYWTGESDLKTEAEVYELQIESVDPEEDENFKQLQKRVELFNSLGYRYEGAGMAHFDFEGVAPGTSVPKGEHRLTPLDGTTPGSFFSNDELAKLISDLKEHIAFECFKKSRP